MKKAKYYKKKPIPVFAREWNGESDLDLVPRGKIHDIYEGIESRAGSPFKPFYMGLLDTPEGHMAVRSGDMILGPGAEGEFWVVKKSIFEKTYELEFQDEPEEYVIQETCDCGLFVLSDCDCKKEI